MRVVEVGRKYSDIIVIYSRVSSLKQFSKEPEGAREQGTSLERCKKYTPASSYRYFP
jgi:hypothetical protein